MKRTALTRRQPLRAKPGARLAPSSAKQAARLARYKAMLADWQGVRRCAWCGECDDFVKLEPHHPFGRSGDNLFRVILLTPTYHRWIHEYPDRAYELGWLQPEYRGVIRPPNFPVPWSPESLITDIPTP